MKDKENQINGFVDEEDLQSQGPKITWLVYEVNGPNEPTAIFYNWSEAMDYIAMKETVDAIYKRVTFFDINPDTSPRVVLAGIFHLIAEYHSTKKNMKPPLYITRPNWSLFNDWFERYEIVPTSPPPLDEENTK